MNYNLPTHLSNLPIYKKSIEILILSRKISTYLSYDLSYLKPNGKEHTEIYFSGDIVQHSTSLAPKIISAELESFSEKKHKHIESLNLLIQRLYKNCGRLELSNTNGKDYLKLLKDELNKFKQLQRSWVMTL